LPFFELLVFMGVVSPGFSMANFVKGWSGARQLPSPGRYSGILRLFHFAILVLLAIERCDNGGGNELSAVPIAITEFSRWWCWPLA
jgi:hypothetical protein